MENFKRHLRLKEESRQLSYMSPKERCSFVIKYHVDLELIRVVNILESNSVNDLCNKYMSVSVDNGKLKYAQTDLNVETIVQPVT